MTLKLILEANGHRQVLSLDALAELFLQAIQAAVRQEVQRLPSGSTPAPPEQKKSEAVRPMALSKAKAALALGVSVRTLDYCIAQRKIRVLRIGRRVLVPMNSIEAVLKRGVLETPRTGGLLCSMNRQQLSKCNSLVQVKFQQRYGKSTGISPAEGVSHL